MPTDNITATLAYALTGGPDRTHRVWVVEGTNARGEDFLTRPRLKYDALDFAAEVNSKGGTAKARRATTAERAAALRGLGSIR